MMPIRIYATPQRHSSDDYYSWELDALGDADCYGGDACFNCVFDHPGNCMVIADYAIRTFKPKSGYVELTQATHPELFL